MNNRRRRWLALTALLPFALGVSHAAPTSDALTGNPTDTSVQGIDVDATTIPRLQHLMDTHQLTSVQLTQFYLQRIEQLNPTLHAIIKVSPTALDDARAEWTGYT